MSLPSLSGKDVMISHLEWMMPCTLGGSNTDPSLTTTLNNPISNLPLLKQSCPIKFGD